MNIKSIKYGLIFLAVLVFSTGFTSLWAEENTDFLTIQRVPELSPDGASVPNGTVKEGMIEVIEKEGIIIGDSSYTFARTCLFLSHDRNPISFSRFEPGMTVGLRLNKKGRITVMWIDETKRGDED